ncbi:MAG: hypothetical protein ABJC74_16695 [Gemmatimonadota bacterium]
MKCWRPLRDLGLAAALLLTASCGTDGPTSPTATTAPAPVAVVARPDASILGGLTNTLGGGLNGLTGGLLNGLLGCSQQPYNRTTQVVGVAGGTIRVGRHSLVLPRGALNRDVTITAEAPSDEVASVRFSPEGLQFNAGHLPRVTLDYSTCPLGRLQLLKHVAYTTERLQILDILSSVDNLLLMRVSAPLHHFSRYAVAW